MTKFGMLMYYQWMKKTKHASFTFTLNDLTSIVEKILVVLQGHWDAIIGYATGTWKNGYWIEQR